MVDITRRFDGELFKHVYSGTKKANAQKYAERLREKGYRARVVDTHTTPGLLNWSVFRSFWKYKRRKK